MVSNYAGSLDPIQQDQTYDPTLRQDTRPGQATDASQRSKLGQMWDAWTSHPENNAAMINFGLQLMQPVQAGQSQLGHFAQAVGAGAEGLQRNVAAEEERQKYEESQGLKEREQARKEEETGIYGEAVRSRGQAPLRKLSPLELSIKSQQEFQRYMRAPVDPLGADPYITALNKAHPEAGGKLTKADLAANRQYQLEVMRMMSPATDQYTGGIIGQGTTMDTPPQAAAPQGQPVYDQTTGALKGYWSNGRLIPAGQ